MSTRKRLDSDLKKDDAIQAVLIADSFDKNFDILTTDETAKCLLPLGDRPMLAYTLDFLKLSGVEEVIIHCTRFAPKIRNFLSSGKYTWNGMAITSIGNEDCRSLGDAMRDLDSKGLLRQDFILISSGDTVGNVDLRPILDQHKKNRLHDRNAIMTLVHKKAAPGNHLRSIEENFVVAITPKRQLLHRVKVDSKKIKFPLEAFVSHDEVELKYDFVETGIAICSQEVPVLFADNFDCQTFSEFIKGTLENDLTDHTIYVHCVEDQSYAARVHNMVTYQAVTKDIMRRWLYPLVPNKDHSYSFFNIYKAKDILIQRESLLMADVIISSGTSVGQHSKISCTVIGKNCKIGDNVTLRNCIIYDDVIVENNSSIENSIVGNKVFVPSEVEIHEKCILGSGVHLKPKIVIRRGTRLTASNSFSSNKGDDSQFGPKAFEYESDIEDDESDDSDDEGRQQHDPWGENLESSHETSCDSESEISDVGENIQDIGLDDDAKYKVFLEEVLESLQRGVQEGVQAENLVLEINSSRHAYAPSIEQLIEGVYISLAKIAESLVENEDSVKKLFASCKKIFTKFKQVLSNYTASHQSQKTCLEIIAKHAKGHERFFEIVPNIIHHLYIEDVLSDGAILDWFEDVDDKLKSKLEPLIASLQESSEESSSDEE